MEIVNALISKALKTLRAREGIYLSYNPAMAKVTKFVHQMLKLQQKLELAKDRARSRELMLRDLEDSYFATLVQARSEFTKPLTEMDNAAKIRAFDEYLEQQKIVLA